MMARAGFQKVRRRIAWHAAAALLLGGLGAWQLAGAAWIHAKAALAQALIASAWRDAQPGEAPRRPWPGADLRPVARLTIAARGIELYVLDAATPRALAFGPGLVGGSAPPGTRGHVMLAAHRDTHFRFLQRLAPGDVIEVETAGGGAARYRVREAAIIDRDDREALDPALSQLTLVTCYPFDAVQHGTRLRYAVSAGRIA